MSTTTQSTTVRNTAVRLRAEGFHPTVIYPAGIVVKDGGEPEDGKRPMGEKWGLNQITIDLIYSRFRRYPKAGAGLCMGPGKAPGRKWLIDAEGDGSQAPDSLNTLCGGEDIKTRGWMATRGDHALFIVEDEARFSAIVEWLGGSGDDVGVIKVPELPDLELRVGGTRGGQPIQIQCVCPPSIGTNGKPREWNGVETIAVLPEAAYAFLERLAAEREARSHPTANGSPGGNGKPTDGFRVPKATTELDGLKKWWAIKLAALAAEVAKTVKPGRRTALRANTITMAGYAANPIVRRYGLLDEATIVATMKAAGRDCGLEQHRIDEAVDSGMEYGRANPLDWPERLDPPGDKAKDDTLDARLAKLPRTDLGNGERLAARFGKDLRYCYPWGKWLCWDGRRWAIDLTGAVRRKAKATVRGILREASTIKDDEKRKEHTKWWANSEGRGRVDAMLVSAAAELGIAILPEQMDRDPWLLNVLNGTIDLRTGKLRPHRREDVITKLCPVEYDPDAQCPLWLSTLDLFFDRPDPEARAELIRYWQRLCGYVLVGVIRDHVLPVAYGIGSNGKSTILGAMLDVLGIDYAMKATPDLFMAKKTDTHPTDRADLFGKRLVVVIETESGRRLNESMVKELTGGDRVRARRMREDFWEFAPSHTLVMATNHKPAIRGTDNGIWRRLKLVPFTVALTDDQADKAMPEKLRAELPGILAWCVRGCLEWQRDGVEPPQEVVDATSAYRAEQDLLGAFLAECTFTSPTMQAKAGELYARYRHWGEAGSEHVMTSTMFGLAMQERGFEKKTSNGVWYLGVGLKPESETTSDDDYPNF
jgi:putative DNA primase/helicase